MHLPFLQQDTIIQALGWTFVHSLWQGMLLAILAGLIILLTRKSRAGLRYILLLSLFCLFLAGTIVTFISQLNKETAAASAHTLAPAIAYDKGTGGSDLLPPVINAEVQQANTRFTDRFVDYFNTHAPMIVLIWFIVFSARMVRLLANLGYVQRIRHYKTHTPNHYWKRRMQQMAKELLIRRKVQLLESGIVNVPIVVGFFKPVILVPLGLITHLPPAQVEAILLHELAHIKRRDYLVNLLQSFAETIFFFNPAVLWLSSLIREERENCCDDIAVAAAGNKTAFLDALVAFQEYTNTSISYGMAFPGRKNHLLNRVKRILHQKNKTLNTMEKSLLTLSIAFIMLLMLSTVRQVQAQNDMLPVPKVAPVQPVQPAQPAPPPRQQHAAPAIAPAPPSLQQDIQGSPAPRIDGIAPQPPLPPVVGQVTVTPAVEVSLAPITPAPPVLKIDVAPKIAIDLKKDTAAPGENQFPHLSCNIDDNSGKKIETLEATDQAGINYYVIKVNDQITTLLINGVEVPKDQYDKYKPVIEQMEQQRIENRKKAEEMRKIRMEQRVEAQQRQQEQRIREQEARLQQVKILRETNMQRDQRLAEMERERVISDKQKKLAEIERDKDMRNQQEVERRVGLAERNLEKEKERIAMADRDANKADMKLRMDIKRNPHILFDKRRDVFPDEAAYVNHRKEMARSLISELVKDDIIKEGKIESFGLTDHEFIVNGKKQPDSVLEKYKAKFLLNPAEGLFYGPVKMSGTGFFIGKDDL